MNGKRTGTIFATKEEIIKGYLLKLHRLLKEISAEYGGKASFIIALEVDSDYDTFYYTGSGKALPLAKKVVDRIQLGHRIQKKHEEEKIPLGSKTWAFRFRFATEYRDDFQSGNFGIAPPLQRQSIRKR